MALWLGLQCVLCVISVGFAVFFQVQSVVILNANSRDPASIWTKLDQHLVPRAPFQVVDCQIEDQWIQKLSAKADREAGLIMIMNTLSSVELEAINQAGLWTKVKWIFPECNGLDELPTRLDTQVYCLNFNLEENVFIILEVYRVKEVHLFRQEVARYDPKNDFITGESNIWIRRANLTGITLVNLALPWAGGREQVVHSGNGSLKVIGEYHDLIYDFQNIMGFHLINREPMDGEFGSDLGNGTWSGILGELNANKADLTSVGYANHEGRKGVVDFSKPLGPIQSVLIMSESQGPEWTVWPYVRPFSPLVWGAYSICLLALVFVLYLTGNATPLGTVLIFVIQRGDFGKTRFLSERGALICLGMLTFVMFAHYSAILTTNLTILDSPKPLDTLEEVYHKNKQLIFAKGELIELIMQAAPTGSVVNKLYVETIKDNPDVFVQSLKEAIEAVLADPDKVYYSAIGPHIPGTKSNLLQMNSIFSTSYAFPPNSEFRSLFNFYIERIKESGLKEHLRLRHTPPMSMDHAQDQAGLGLDLSWTLGPFLSVAIGIGLSALTVVLEITIARCLVAMNE